MKLVRLIDNKGLKGNPHHIYVTNGPMKYRIYYTNVIIDTADLNMAYLHLHLINNNFSEEYLSITS